MCEVSRSNWYLSDKSRADVWKYMQSVMISRRSSSSNSTDSKNLEATLSNASSGHACKKTIMLIKFG